GPRLPSAGARPARAPRRLEVTSQKIAEGAIEGVRGRRARGGRLDSEAADDLHPAHRRSAPVRRRSAASHSVGRRQFLALSAAGLVAAGLPRAARAQGKRSGELVAGLSERMLTLDPANHYSISSTSVHRHMFDPLVDVTNDSKFVPALAESWRAVNDTTWRFTLRKGVTFHDGTPFN